MAAAVFGNVILSLGSIHVASPRAKGGGMFLKCALAVRGSEYTWTMLLPAFVSRSRQETLGRAVGVECHTVVA